MGPIGLQEMMGILLIALLLFGPKKLPELGRTLGKALTQFRRAKEELRTTFESHMRELEREVKLSEQPKSLPPYPDYSSGNQTYPYEQPVTSGHLFDPPALNPEVLAAPAPLPELAAPESQPVTVNGTVARSNGVHPSPALAAPVEGEAPRSA